MSEDGTTEAAVTTEAAPAVTTTTAPTSYISDTGEFTEGWKDKYVPEAMRGDAIFDRTKSIEGMASMLSNFDRMKGADTMVKPNDKFGDGDWDEFHRAGGWTGQVIPITAPDGLPEGVWSDDRATAYSEKFNELKLYPWQVEGLMEMHNSDIAQQLTNATNNAENSRSELEAGLLADWGNAMEQKKGIANFAVDKGTGGDAEFKARLLQKFGNDPDFIRYSAELGGGYAEAKGVVTSQASATPVEIQTKINEVMSSDAYMKPMHPEHKTAMTTLRRLYEEKGSSRPAVA